VIAVTIDVDDVAWTTGAPADELRVAVPRMVALLGEFPAVRTTWFVRLDAGIAAAHGRPDALLVDHAPLWRALRTAGHEIAWHHHAVQPGAATVPETRRDRICQSLQQLAPYAQAHALVSVRLGWAHADARILSCLDDLGFTVDSTALPRPAYSWDAVPRDWEGAPTHPYHPARNDHRRAGTPACALLEVPLTVAAIPSPSDTRAHVLRYLNPAYHPDVFDQAIRAVTDLPVIVTVTHPYECVPAEAHATASTTRAHPLLAHDLEALRRNLTRLTTLGRPFVTLQQVRSAHAATARHHAA
jgi:hypothetical protein